MRAIEKRKYPKQHPTMTKCDAVPLCYTRKIARAKKSQRAAFIKCFCLNEELLLNSQMYRGAEPFNLYYNNCSLRKMINTQHDACLHYRTWARVDDVYRQRHRRLHAAAAPWNEKGKMIYCTKLHGLASLYVWCAEDILNAHLFLVSYFVQRTGRDKRNRESRERHHEREQIHNKPTQPPYDLIPNCCCILRNGVYTQFRNWFI